MRILIHLNDIVRVRLTERGHALLKFRHDKQFAKTPDLYKPKYQPPVEDANGYSQWPLWEIIHQLGNSFNDGIDPAIEPEIEIGGT